MFRIFKYILIWPLNSMIWLYLHDVCLHYFTLWASSRTKGYKYIISETAVALYVGLMLAALPTQYVACMTFSTNWLRERST